MITLEGHGREQLFDIDTSRTIGWFTSKFPVHLKIYDKSDLSQAIKNTKEQLRLVPNKGLGYGVLKYFVQKLSNNTNSSNILFNYLGQWHDTSIDPNTLQFKSIKIDNIQNISLDNKPNHFLVINCEIIEEQFAFSITYNENTVSLQEIDSLLEQYRNNLQKLIEHCMERGGDDNNGA